MVPFGHTFITPQNYYELMVIVLEAKEAMRNRYGADYIVGSISEVMCK